jgi:hypothetical protein
MRTRTAPIHQRRFWRQFGFFDQSLNSEIREPRSHPGSTRDLPPLRIIEASQSTKVVLTGARPILRLFWREKFGTDSLNHLLSAICYLSSR